ncbi:hypothetical protein ARMGADRAFT_1033370 [Armillaria gallica]|uniref:Uncharacterized protein n=1 Tax=Armillaria gallica TaxID=47427 RepID=A0A2H3D219_ARMGA|nr:hypothetical protein ARMGADRAFT_1033370 [Armillaria gallica]
MNVSIESIRNIDVVVGAPRLVWFPTDHPVNESFVTVVDHLVVKVVETYAYDFGKLKQARCIPQDNLAVLARIVGRHYRPPHFSSDPGGPCTSQQATTKQPPARIERIGPHSHFRKGANDSSASTCKEPFLRVQSWAEVW